MDDFVVPEKLKVLPGQAACSLVELNERLTKTKAYNAVSCALAEEERLLREGVYGLFCKLDCLITIPGLTKVLAGIADQ
jgi:hypothetical protein